ncbi:pyridine nucleotide-disulfide oxidoreductase domain-containing protein 1-like [Ostrea edulis]|uniref:pyridine nucleotide-disulfide oxidoreductase domain-containing protein 1-like n=1 Tax=Ostrea edulis TaxID=37623 RepID=UPI0024AEAC5F|nr:pyridine nucleotide-disulfide oxidoreductase domain-containing protein 1-like [Ostrea edulis]
MRPQKNQLIFFRNNFPFTEIVEEYFMMVKYVVVGGGIAGVTCVETLSSLCPEEEILLVTASPLIKAITNYKKITKTLEDFDVEERSIISLQSECVNVKVIQKSLHSLNAKSHVIKLSDGEEVHYQKLCLCTGGRPKLITDNNPYVLGIRDTESVKEFQKRLSKARRIMVVGNGGIATELIYEVEGCEVVWAIKDRSISSTFVDPGAGEFFMSELNKKKETREEAPSKRLKYTVEDVETESSKSTAMGGALGPDWSAELSMTGTQKISHCVTVEKCVEVRNVLAREEFVSSGKSSTDLSGNVDQDCWPVYVELTNDKVYGCDLLVSATGVVPNTSPVLTGNQFTLAEDGGIRVDDKMRTSEDDVYAAGDVCTASWEPAQHWLQMRLWSQARQMGAYAGQSMVADFNSQPISLDFCFEVFAHVTKFFNHKVILLGKFNAQGLGSDYEILLRVTKGSEYVKVVLRDGRMEGAVLIGETDLEETFENLILNQIDLTPFKDDLLDPNIDIEDFFD